MFNFLALALLSLLSSCGRGSHHSPVKLSPKPRPVAPAPTIEPAPPEQLVTEGNYRSVLRALNKNIKGNEAYGTSVIDIKDDRVSVQLNTAYLPGLKLHIQSIHESGSCPSPEDDSNKDSYVDYAEGMKAFGWVLIPLDKDLSAQIPGNEAYNRSSSDSYTYSNDTDLSLLLVDLQGPDEDTKDQMIKLKKDEAINLEKRTLVISAVPNYDLPESVHRLTEYSGEAFLPIACGEIVRVRSED